MDKKSKVPRFFLIMLLILTIAMFIGMLFSFYIAGGATYFVVLILSVVLFAMSRSSKHDFTNFRLTYLGFDILNLIAVISITYFEWSRVDGSTTLNVFNICLLILTAILILVDVFVLDEKSLNKKADVGVCMLLVATNVCISTYFYNVSDFWFSGVAVVLQMISFAIKVCFLRKSKKQKNVPQKNEEKIEEIIHEDEEREGEIEE